ncbi:MAG: amine dehydrogenase large subunit [Gammaproteobacteria bacterium]
MNNRLISGISSIIVLCMAFQVQAELPADKIGNVETLPAVYPDSWVFVHDVSFMHMSSGKFIVMDIEGETMEEYYKGIVNSSYIGFFAVARSKPEFYVIDNFYSRGQRGKLSEVITIYDKRTLSPIDEVVLKEGKRAEMIPSKYAARLIDNDSLLLFYKFSPAMAIGVMDTDKRKIVNNIPLPSCAGVYPTGTRGFSSLCSDGSMISYQLDKDGQVKSTERVAVFFSVDDDALFEKPALVGQVAYFPTFTGNIQEVDLSATVAKPGKKWPLASAAERKANWRPGGAWPAAATGDRIYVLMHENGYEGSHKDPGSEIWVYDTVSKKRQQRIKLQLPSIAMDITAGDKPMIVSTNVEMALEIYDAISGKYIRTIDDFYRAGPLLVYASP